MLYGHYIWYITYVVYDIIKKHYVRHEILSQKLKLEVLERLPMWSMFDCNSL